MLAGAVRIRQRALREPARAAEAVEKRLVSDLCAGPESGRWAERNSGLLDLDEIHIGSRLLIA